MGRHLSHFTALIKGKLLVQSLKAATGGVQALLWAAAGSLFVVLPAVAQTSSKGGVNGMPDISPDIGFSQLLVFFFITLGPAKILAPFMALTKDADDNLKRQIAIRATLLSTVSLILAGFLGGKILTVWRVSLNSLVLTVGIILFLVALHMVLQLYNPGQPQTQSQTPSLELATTPLTFPLIITPYGLGALIVFIALSTSVRHDIEIIGVVLIIMILNLLAMLYARSILRTIGVTALQIIGSILLVFQVALGLEIIIRGLVGLGLINK